MSIQDVPIRPPRQWSPEWFQRWVYETLAPFLGGSGSGGDVTDLIAASLVTADPEGGLPNARALAGQAGVLEIVDHGPGESVEIRLEAASIALGYLASVSGLSLIGNRFTTDQAPQAIIADDDDTIARRVAGAIDFGVLTVDMAPDALWTYAKLQDAAAASILGRSADSAGVLADIEAGANDQVLRRDSDALSFGAVPDGAISETGVTQHEAALAIDFGQLSGPPAIPGGLDEYADDTAAAGGGIDVGGLYRTGSVVKIRVS